MDKKEKTNEKIELKESEVLEFKKSTSELKEAVVSIGSMLNKHSEGELYFGVKDNGDVIGQQIGKSTIRDVSQAIAAHIEQKIFPKINRVVLDGKDCVHVEFSGSNRPYYAYGRAYIRVGDEDRRLSAKELEKMILEKNKTLWEKQFSEKKLKDVNEKILKGFIERANKVKRINFKYTKIKNILLKLHLLKENKLLRAGEVLFCEDTDYEVQAAVFAGKEKLTFLDITNFKGSLFTLLDKSVSYIKEHMDWGAALTGEGREEVPEIPVRAIEEAIVNSLCHRDYSNIKANEIAFYQDRIEIYNPGQFPEEHNPEEYIKGEGESILRNPLIANTLFLSKDIEKWGSGIKRIYEACKEAKVKVEFREVKTGFKVIFYRKKSLEKTRVKNRVKTREKIIQLIKDNPRITQKELGEKLGEKLGENEIRIIEFIIENKYITAKELSEKIGISTTAIDNNMAKLRKKSILRRVGSYKGGHWEIIENDK